MNISDKEREKTAGGRELPTSESNRMIVRRERLCFFPCLCNVEWISGDPSYLRWCWGNAGKFISSVKEGF